MASPPPPNPAHRGASHGLTRVLAAPVHTLLLYSRPLHPELFQMKGRRTMAVRGADVEAWLMPSGHMLRYQTKTHCACELVSDRDSSLPTSGVVTTFPAVGERDFENLFAEACVLYTTSVQTENLTETIYRNTLREMRELAEETSAMIHEWIIPSPDGAVLPNGGRCLSMLELQRFEDEIHAQGTHMFPVSGLVLRSQSVFQRV